VATSIRPNPVLPLDEDDLLDCWRAAEVLSVTEPAIRKLVARGLIPTIKLGDKPKSRLRIRRGDLAAFVAASTRPATAGPLAQQRP